VEKLIDYSTHTDPEYRRWGKKYPHFPGVAECVRLLRSRKARGAWIDIITLELAAHANECLPELAAAFRSEADEWVRLMVLLSVADARLPVAIEFLTEVAREQHPRFAPCAERGLAEIGNSEARTALWKAEHPRRIRANFAGSSPSDALLER
jgi:hypothetical protein